MPRTKSEEKRQEILDAAEAAFGRREFDEVTTDDIAAGAGVGKGTLYRYFPTKEDLYAATLLRAPLLAAPHALRYARLLRDHGELPRVARRAQGPQARAGARGERRLTGVRRTGPVVV